MMSKTKFKWGDSCGMSWSVSVRVCTGLARGCRCTWAAAGTRHSAAPRARRRRPGNLVVSEPPAHAAVYLVPPPGLRSPPPSPPTRPQLTRRTEPTATGGAQRRRRPPPARSAASLPRLARSLATIHFVRPALTRNFDITVSHLIMVSVIIRLWTKSDCHMLNVIMCKDYWKTIEEFKIYGIFRNSVSNSIKEVIL